MSAEQIRTLYAYTSWANGQIFDAAADLDEARLEADAGASFGSVRDTLVHVVSAQRTWLARARRQANPDDLRADTFSNLAAIRDAWMAIDADTRDFVEGLDEADLSETVSYVNSQGRPNAYPLWQILVHQANHAAQHRSEVALVLTRFGHSPGWLDFLYYLDLHNGPRPSPA